MRFQNRFVYTYYADLFISYSLGGVTGKSYDLELGQIPMMRPHAKLFTLHINVGE